MSNNQSRSEYQREYYLKNKQKIAQRKVQQYAIDQLNKLIMEIDFEDQFQNVIMEMSAHNPEDTSPGSLQKQEQLILKAKFLFNLKVMTMSPEDRAKFPASIKYVNTLQTKLV